MEEEDVVVLLQQLLLLPPRGDDTDNTGDEYDTADEFGLDSEWIDRFVVGVPLVYFVQLIALRLGSSWDTDFSFFPVRILVLLFGNVSRFIVVVVVAVVFVVEMLSECSGSLTKSYRR